MLNKEGIYILSGLRKNYWQVIYQLNSLIIFVETDQNTKTSFNTHHFLVYFFNIFIPT